MSNDGTAGFIVNDSVGRELSGAGNGEEMEVVIYDDEDHDSTT